MKRTLTDKLLSYIVYIVMTIIALIAIYPIALAFSASVSDNLNIEKYGYSLIPMKFSLDAYKIALQGDWVYRAYLITIIVVVIGTFLSIAITSMLGYALSNRTIKYRSIISFYCIITLVFHAGLVPWYLVLRKYYGFGDSIWSLIIPYLVNPWYMFLMRNYFESIPDSLSESARIDGANTMTIFVKIILPLSKPILATVGMFIALVYWNDWWLSLLFIKSKALYPLQYQLFSILSNIEFLTSGEADANVVSSVNLPRETIKMATTMITIGPIILLYPIVQKYFIKGIMVGAVKG